MFFCVTPQNSENSPFAMFNIFESFGIEKPIRNMTFGNLTCNCPFASHAHLPLVSKKLVTILGIWLQSSNVAIFCLFIASIRITSLIVDELERNIEKFLLEFDEYDSTVLEKWWNQINFLNNLVGGINDCFGHFLVLNLCFIFLNSLTYWGTLYFDGIKNTYIPIFPELEPFLKIGHNYFCFLFIAVGSNQLKTKVRYFLNRYFHMFKKICFTIEHKTWKKYYNKDQT